jgi:hypothetical protein
MPRIAFRVVCGTALTIATFPPQSRFTKVDFPTEGRPITATNAAFLPQLISFLSSSLLLAFSFLISFFNQILKSPFSKILFF